VPALGCYVPYPRDAKRGDDLVGKFFSEGCDSATECGHGAAY
jgi:hypothetical protein